MSTTFPLFPTLPTELRLAIYRQILAQSTHPILKISLCPSSKTYISNTVPPITLSICAESRALTLESWGYLRLGDGKEDKIPMNFESQTLYISSLLPLLLAPDLLQSFLYQLSTSPSRHHITSLAVDLRIFHTLSENGFLGIIGGMKKLRTAKLVVEFGRSFEGEIAFLKTPEWRNDLRWLAGRVGDDVRGERERSKGIKIVREAGDTRNNVVVECVILTRGGEHA
jgi:hypothetical protein